MFMLFLCWDEFVEEAEELVYLWLWKVSVVRGILDFEGIDFRIFACDYVRERAEAWVAHRNPYRVAAVALKKLDEHALAVESSLAPTSKGNFVDVSNHESFATVDISLCCSVIKDYRSDCGKCVRAMLQYTESFRCAIGECW